MHDTEQSHGWGPDEQATCPDGTNPDGCTCTIAVAGTRLVLMANRLVWWPDEKLLLLADSHFGKAATFRKAGLPVPMGTTCRMLQELSGTLNSLRPSRLVLLGDFVHSATSARIDFERELLEWRQIHSALPITLVVGNHDRNRQRLFKDLQLNLCDEETCGPLYFCHDPFAQPALRSDGFRLGGHVHPGIRLTAESQWMPCFWQGDDFLVLPAFGAFTGLAKIAPRPRDALYPIFDGRVAKILASNLKAPASRRAGPR